MKKFSLILIPTPLNLLTPLESSAVELIQKHISSNDHCLIVFEQAKEARRRWLLWGLPREWIEKFDYLNEHNVQEKSNFLLNEMKKGITVLLMSDGGLPAFCDPGRILIDLCHQHQLEVTSTAFHHSVALSIALSGFNCDEYFFAGFLPRNSLEREKKLKKLLDLKMAIVIMDTPYRLKALLETLRVSTKEHGVTREVFIAMDLCSDAQELQRGNISTLIKKISNFKREFVLILAPID